MGSYKDLRTVYIRSESKDDLTIVISLLKDRGWTKGYLPITGRDLRSTKPPWVTDFVVYLKDLETFREDLKLSCLPLGLEFISFSDEGSRYFILSS